MSEAVSTGAWSSRRGSRWRSSPPCTAAASGASCGRWTRSTPPGTLETSATALTEILERGRRGPSAAERGRAGHQAALRAPRGFASADHRRARQPDRRAARVLRAVPRERVSRGAGDGRDAGPDRAPDGREPLRGQAQRTHAPPAAAPQASDPARPAVAERSLPAGCQVTRRWRGPARISASASGSTFAPCRLTVQCRWGPVARPVAPDEPDLAAPRELVTFLDADPRRGGSTSSPVPRRGPP